MSWGRQFLAHLVNDFDYREEDMSKELLYRTAYLIPEQESYSSWEGRPVGYSRAVAGLGAVTLVENERKDDGWGESWAMNLVFKVVTPEGEVGFFRKRGYEDSYGTEKWDGNLVPVQETAKTITTYTEV